MGHGWRITEGPLSHLPQQIPQPTPEAKIHFTDRLQVFLPFLEAWTSVAAVTGPSTPCWGRALAPFWGPPIHSLCSWAGLRTVVSAAPLPGPWQAEGAWRSRGPGTPTCRLLWHWAPSRQIGQRLRAQSLVNNPGARSTVNAGGWGGSSSGPVLPGEESPCAPGCGLPRSTPFRGSLTPDPALEAGHEAPEDRWTHRCGLQRGGDLCPALNTKSQFSEKAVKIPVITCLDQQAVSHYPEPCHYYLEEEERKNFISEAEALFQRDGKRF